MTSLGASIPPELFENILYFVGNDLRIDPHDVWSQSAQRQQKKHVSACAATCVYWARLTRPHIFHDIDLRSYNDYREFLSILRAYPRSQQLEPVGSMLKSITLRYTLGDLPWFHSFVANFKTYGIEKSTNILLHINSPASPAFIAASTRRSVSHPLSFATPQTLTMSIFRDVPVKIYIKNIHLPNLAVLFNLLQDCASLQAQVVECESVTWDHDPGHAPSGLVYTCHKHSTRRVFTTGCTDDALVAVMLHSVPPYMTSPARKDPRLSSADTSYLLDVMRLTRGPSELSDVFNYVSNQFKATTVWSNNDHLSSRETGMLLHWDTDLYIEWSTNTLDGSTNTVFRCFTDRLPDILSGIRSVTCIAIELQTGWPPISDPLHLISSIDWGAFLHAVQQFPSLRRIVIQYNDMGIFSEPGPDELLVAFVAHLVGAWAGLDNLLEIYSGQFLDMGGESQYVRVELEEILAASKQKKEEAERGSMNERGADEEPVSLSDGTISGSGSDSES